jgi:hypothetical protein
MTTEYDDVYEDAEDFDTQAPAQGKDLVKDLRKQLAEKAKTEKALADELAALRKQSRDSSISGFLNDAGISPKVAKLIPSDVEPTQEAVSQWLEEYGDVFGVQKTEQEVTPPSEPDPAVVGQMRAMQAVAESGSAPGGPSNVTVDDLASAESKDALLALIKRSTGG